MFTRGETMPGYISLCTREAWKWPGSSVMNRTEAPSDLGEVVWASKAAAARGSMMNSDMVRVFMDVYLFARSISRFTGKTQDPSTPPQLRWGSARDDKSVWTTTMTMVKTD